jgi:hypothetical protein
MRQLASDRLQLAADAETDGFRSNERGSLEGSLVILGLSYLGLVCLMFYIDYKMQVRRVRKRLEAKREAPAPKEGATFEKDEEDLRR